MKRFSPIAAAIPYIMPRCYDAQNMTTVAPDEETIRTYIRVQRKLGWAVTHMSLLISAYYKAYVENPKINCFVMNRRTDMRNYFCVSLVILKTLAAGSSDETTLKVFVEKHDTIYTLSRKLEDAIRQNTQETHSNNTDKFVKAAFVAGAGPIGVLAGLSFGPARSAAPEDHGSVSVTPACL